MGGSQTSRQPPARLPGAGGSAAAGCCPCCWLLRWLWRRSSCGFCTPSRSAPATPFAKASACRLSCTVHLERAMPCAAVPHVAVRKSHMWCSTSQVVWAIVRFFLLLPMAADAALPSSVAVVPVRRWDCAAVVRHGWSDAGRRDAGGGKVAGHLPGSVLPRQHTGLSSPSLTYTQ
jgi:hypothetical protein